MADPVQELAEFIFTRIAHGDEEHRAWLKAEAERIAREWVESRG